MARRGRRFVLLMLAIAAVGAASWAALAAIPAGSHEQVYVIPKGTWAQRYAGKHVEVLPSEIRLTLGVRDILVLRNDDDVPQMFGPVLIMPGQRFEMPFRLASRYQFACSLHTSGQLAVIVDPAPEPGWARLRWRTRSMLDGWL
jgi:hypothetical protein